MNLTPQQAMRAAIAVPGVPRDEDGPVFREPWEARAFAMALALHEAGVFPGRNGRRRWARKSSARRPQAIPTPARPITGTGSPRWKRWSPPRASRHRISCIATATPGTTPPTARRMARDRADAWDFGSTASGPAPHTPASPSRATRRPGICRSHDPNRAARRARRGNRYGSVADQVDQPCPAAHARASRSRPCRATSAAYAFEVLRHAEIERRLQRLDGLVAAIRIAGEIGLAHAADDVRGRAGRPAPRRR